jgi:hypothetical protein
MYSAPIFSASSVALLVRKTSVLPDSGSLKRTLCRCYGQFEPPPDLEEAPSIENGAMMRKSLKLRGQRQLGVLHQTARGQRPLKWVNFKERTTEQPKPSDHAGLTQTTCANSVLPTIMRHPGLLKPQWITNLKSETLIVHTHETLETRGSIDWTPLTRFMHVFHDKEIISSEQENVTQMR